MHLYSNTSSLKLWGYVPHIKEHQTVVCVFSVIYISYVLTFVSVARQVHEPGLVTWISGHAQCSILFVFHLLVATVFNSELATCHLAIFLFSLVVYNLLSYIRTN